MAQSVDKSNVPYKTLQEEEAPQGPPPSYAQTQVPQAGYPQGQQAYPQGPQAGFPQGGYPQGPPAPYPQGYPMAPVTQQPQIVNTASANVVVQTGAVRPSSYMVLSCFVYWCCNWLFGGIAFALSMASSNAADENDMTNARSYGRAAFWVNISGIMVSVLALIIFCVVYFVVLANSDDPYGYVNNDYYNK